ncbi:GDSL-type esterase/lipase family protein [Azospira restricta]|uniref:Arylesterase n=1 Tax=Azospira restricta TaxID=404405 RepID=A0A974Y4Q0_9RHOO|nr:GDSL-type esterase/lipase family protein [Azospira restricta]QRJ64725.1 arylesterase [Azospira restricta]
MRRRTFVAFAAAALLAGCGRKPKLAALPAGATVLAFGDSVTYGTGAAPGEDWPTRLAARSGWRIVNAGVPGDTAEAGRQRIGPLLDEHRPALVIVEIGGNDFLRRRPQAAVKEDLRAIVAAARAAGAQVVLVAVPELSLLGAVTRKPSDAPIYAELGDEEKLPVVADVFADTLGDPALRADAIHPNAHGYERMAGELHAALRRLGLLR